MRKGLDENSRIQQTIISKSISTASNNSNGNTNHIGSVSQNKKRDSIPRSQNGDNNNKNNNNNTNNNNSRKPHETLFKSIDNGNTNMSIRESNSSLKA